MPRQLVSIAMPDGTCSAQLLTPADTGAWPAIIFFMDGFGIRPTLTDMAERLAAQGFAVLLPDLYYRFGPYEPLDPAVVYAGDRRALLQPLRVTIDDEKAVADTRIYLDFLADRPEVLPIPVGLVGFCMGGRFALAAAGTYGDRIAAAASFHGGYLAADDAHSPHLLAPGIRAEIYVAGAEDDASYPPAMASRLERALSEANVKHRCEIYPGTKHSWMMRDIPAYHEDGAERGWTAMLDLFERALAPRTPKR